MRINNLKRTIKGKHICWEEPKYYVIQSVHEQKILPVKVQGIWEFTSSKTSFKLENLYVIVEFFDKVKK